MKLSGGLWFGRKIQRICMRRRGLWEPSGIQKLLISPYMVAYEANLLPLSHPPQHYLHVPLALQIFQSYFLKTVILSTIIFSCIKKATINKSNYIHHKQKQPSTVTSTTFFLNCVVLGGCSSLPNLYFSSLNKLFCQYVCMQQCIL